MFWDKNDKTIVVQVERRLTHPVLKKTVRLTKKYHAHDEGNKFHEGDIVRIQRIRRFQKTSGGWCWSRCPRKARPSE